MQYIDHQDIAVKVTEILRHELGLPADETPAFVLIFAVPPENKEVRYIASTNRADGIKLLKKTASSLGARLN